MNIVVISHNQKEHIQPMIDALEGHGIVYVLDRCTDGSFEHVFPKNITVLDNEHGDGFLAGRMRDIGASYHDPDEPILFLDGDKIPIGDINILPTLGFDCVLLGVENDRREWINVDEGSIPYNDYKNPHNEFYSCGIWLSAKAMKIAKSKCDGRIFHANFDGNWGEEDRYLGDILYSSRLSIGYTTKVKLTGGLTEESECIDKLAVNFTKRLNMRKQWMR